MIVSGSFTVCSDTLLCTSANSVTKVPSIKVHATQRKVPWHFKLLEKEKELSGFLKNRFTAVFEFLIGFVSNKKKIRSL